MLFEKNDRRYVWQVPNMVFEEKNLLPTIKHGASNIMIWKCFAATGTGKIICIDGTIDSAGYQAILNESLLSSVRKLGLGHS